MFRIFLITLFLFNIGFAHDLEGKVTYTEETARIEAFKDLARKLPKAMFQDYLKDKYYKENYENLQNGIYIIEDEPKRTINPFFVMNHIAIYSVRYEDDKNKQFYYNIFGNLVKYEISDFTGVYPYRTVAYNKKGELINITYSVSEEETFIFDKKERLKGHWLNEQYFNNKGKKVFKRGIE